MRAVILLVPALVLAACLASHLTCCRGAGGLVTGHGQLSRVVVLGDSSHVLALAHNRVLLVAGPCPWLSALPAGLAGRVRSG